MSFHFFINIYLIILHFYMELHHPVNLSNDSISIHTVLQPTRSTNQHRAMERSHDLVLLCESDSVL